jgi:hypothetical protein
MFGASPRVLAKEAARLHGPADGPGGRAWRSCLGVPVGRAGIEMDFGKPEPHLSAIAGVIFGLVLTSDPREARHAET